ncbi:MAG TPA: hypothetical protein VK629_18705, partial [Steroidobacteraceae bacterium]|nr:hypothetical protein [Steroidobacteraceae bacterium]
MGDAKFADALELMMFLANMVGIQHVQRFIPIANPDHHGHGTLTELDGLKPVTPPTKSVASSPSTTASDATVAMPRPSSPTAPTPPKPQPAPVTPTTLTVPVLATEAIASQATVQMPRPVIKPAPVADDSTREMPRPQAITPAPQKTTAKTPLVTKKSAPPAPAKGGPVTEMDKLVIEDAVRLLNWGRPWHELAELVARIADRPKVNEVRRLLRAHRSTIEARAADLDSDEGKEKGKKKK